MLRGIESAIRQAKEAAGEKNVEIGIASSLQQCLKAELLDEIRIDLVPVLLGAGIRMFDNLGMGARRIGNQQGRRGVRRDAPPLHGPSSKAHSFGSMTGCEGSRSMPGT